MKLKLILAAAGATVLLHPTPAWSQAQISLEGVPADELAVARDIIAVIYPPETRDAMFEDMMRQVAGQFGSAIMTDPVFEEPGIRAIMDEFLAGLPQRLMPAIKKHMPSMLEATAVAYTREFNLEELEDIRAFARTDTGNHYFGRLTYLLGDPAVAEANKAYFAELQGMQESVKVEIQAKLMEYLVANPEVLDRVRKRSEKGK